MSVDHRRVSAPDELDQSNEALRHLSKAALARDGADDAQTPGKAVAVQKYDRHRGEAFPLFSASTAHGLRDRARPPRFHRRAPLVDFDRGGVKLLGLARCASRRSSAATGSGSAALADWITTKPKFRFDVARTTHT
jgi:hypothetical protein